MLNTQPHETVYEFGCFFGAKHIFALQRVVPETGMAVYAVEIALAAQANF